MTQSWHLGIDVSARVPQLIGVLGCVSGRISRPGYPLVLSDARFIDICIDIIRLVKASFQAYLLVYVLAVDAAAEQGRQRGPVPAAGPQRVGPGTWSR